MKLAKLLRLYRLFESIEQKQVAAEIGVSASVISSIENGKRCDLRTFAKVLTWLSAEDTGKPLHQKKSRTRRRATPPTEELPVHSQ